MSHRAHESPLPPPPATPGPGTPPGYSPSGYVPGDASAQRRRPWPAVVPAITTDGLTAQGHVVSQTPITATILSPSAALSYTPATPAALHPQRPSPLGPTGNTSSPRRTVMEPYDPRQWSSRPSPSGTQMVFQQRNAANMSPSTAEITGMEASMPSPPPPYSPSPAAMTPSLMFGDSHSLTVSPAAERSATESPQASQVPMSPSFPPPPAQFARSSSGLPGQRSFFSLSNLRGKQPVPSDAYPQPQTHTTGYRGPQLASVEATPPAARRAASTGHITAVAAVSASSASSHAAPPPTPGRTSPSSRWQPGTPLPGPPPGPPPAGTRAQSLDRHVIGPSVSSSASSSRDANRRRTMMVSNLEPVPPTPADFVEDDMQMSMQHRAQAEVNSQDATLVEPLHIHTGATRDASLARRRATRDVSTGIRERRSRSRAARASVDISSSGEGASRPGDLVFSPEGGAISRRREHARTASAQVSPPTGGPSSASRSFSAARTAATVLTPPYTPATGHRADDGSKRVVGRMSGGAPTDRPISQVLRAGNDATVAPSRPASPQRPASSGSIKTSTKLDGFLLQAMDRHRIFIDKEAAAASDEERLWLFANYMVNESRLRRDRYAAAYNAMAGEIVDLTRDMWRSYTGTGRRAGTPSTSISSIDPPAPSWTSDNAPLSAHGNVPSSASSYGDMTPGTDLNSMGDPSESGDRSDSRQWPEAFKPSLSPIPSMAVSTVPDEDSSRGRTASRWWEQSNSGSGSIGKPDRMEQSRRETKYMGVSPATLQANDASPRDSGWRPSAAGASAPAFSYGLDEYPPEKVGWHDSTEGETPVPTPQRLSDFASSAATPGIAPLDVSRLVTLPPPYPRHYPAVKNKHPHLHDLRAAHRELADHTDVQKIKEAYLNKDVTITRDQQEAAKQRRADLRADIHRKIANGSMSYADAAQAEATFDKDEAEKGKADARARFEAFEADVSHPMNTLLIGRLEMADTRIRQLLEDLESGQAMSDPNRAQEEGDEHPERLERLTMLKWLFEAREQLHKDMFDFHAMRSDKYAEVILTPHRIAKAQGKIDEATAFFKKDSTDRQIAHAKDAHKRFEELQTVMESNVTRGVEDQLSAFWDIAPGLLEVIQHVPARMDRFDVEIPPQEYGENPSYRAHPLQYLFSLLDHAEKSAYQFVESQINLLCLLHEVRTVTSKARLRCVEVERRAASPHDHNIEGEMEHARAQVDNHLTLDLKEKVGEVERQWKLALGDGMEECKTRVREWLEEHGGFEDCLDG